MASSLSYRAITFSPALPLWTVLLAPLFLVQTSSLGLNVIPILNISPSPTSSTSFFGGRFLLEPALAGKTSRSWWIALKGRI